MGGMGELVEVIELSVSLTAFCCMIRMSCVQISTWPGQQRQLNLVGIDQLGNPTYFIIRLSDGRSDINSGAFTQAGDDLFFNSTSVSRLLVVLHNGAKLH